MPHHFALLDNNYDPNAESYLFTEPQQWITCHDLASAETCLQQIETTQNWAVGFISYEFAKHFGYDCKPTPGANLPYLQFGLFAKRKILTNEEVSEFLSQNFSQHAPFLANIHPRTSPEKYHNAIAKIKSELEAGNTYQVNYTFETALQQGGCPFRLYDALRRAQPVPYGAMLHFPDVQILSRSPELFFEKSGSKMLCKPMKGTEPRSPSLTQDNILRSHLIASPKQRAENLMIVDLLRNDLSRIAEFGSVQVEKLFEVESYQTVHQMTSTISAKIKNKSFSQILEALFPCGSITGAPKKITCEIINRLEPHSRGVYCGAIGMRSPKGDLHFSVPIRTLTLQENHGQFHIGGGVVYDSVDKKEYEEALLKGKFLFDLTPDFSLLDSHFFDPATGARHANEHRARLTNSAKALRFNLDEAKLDDQLTTLYTNTKTASKIRIEISPKGEIKLEAHPIDEYKGSMRVRLSPFRTQSTDPVYQHKTTNRAFYNSEFAQARSDGFYDVIFANERDELSEAAIHNLVLRFGNELLTPPLHAGVLPGIGRAIALQSGQIKEAKLPISALQKADEILLISSIRGLVPVHLETGSD